MFYQFLPISITNRLESLDFYRFLPVLIFLSIDYAGSYVNLEKYGYSHKTVNHSKEFVNKNGKRNEYVTIAVNRNLSNCEKARKKGFRGFDGIQTRGLCVSAAVLYQPELWRPIHWRPANLLSSSTRERNETQNEMMWTAGIQMKWVCDHRSESHLYSRSSHHFILRMVSIRTKLKDNGDISRQACLTLGCANICILDI